MKIKPASFIDPRKFVIGMIAIFIIAAAVIFLLVMAGRGIYCVFFA